MAKTNGTDGTDAPRARKYVSQSDVPRHTLEEALRIPRAIADHYAKQPATPVQIGAAIGVQPTTGVFRSIAGAALAYGLTDGGPRVPQIGLTDVGRRVVAPTEEGDDLIAMREAFLRPRVIREFLEKYGRNNAKLPRRDIAMNVLGQEMGVPPDAAARTLDLILDGAEQLGLLQDIGGSKFVQLQGVAIDHAPRDLAEEPEEEEAEKPSAKDEKPVEQGEGKNGDAPEPPPPPARPSAIFLAHGKSKRPLEQLIKTLDQYGIPHKEAVEEANRGRPISQKVAETMRECGAAILIFSADENFIDADGNEIWRPSENVVHELGAASVLYENRIVIFKEAAVTLATNYGDIGYIEFEKGALDAKVNELFKELIAFGLVKVTVGG